MIDLALAGAWLAVIALAASLCVALRGFGATSAYVRDVIYVGSAIWVLGWPLWTARWVPAAIAIAVALVIALLPRVAAQISRGTRLVRALTADDQRAGGLVLFALAYAAFTVIGLATPFAAAVALLALSLGSGLGVVVERRLGQRCGYRLVVALGAGCAVVVAALWFGVHVAWPLPIAVAAVALGAEAIAPRAGGHLAIPVATWAAVALGGP